MGYARAGDIISDTTVLDNRAVQKLAHHAPHREVSDMELKKCASSFRRGYSFWPNTFTKDFGSSFPPSPTARPLLLPPHPWSEPHPPLRTL